jgi:hypothetical protein
MFGSFECPDVDAAFLGHLPDRRVSHAAIEVTMELHLGEAPQIFRPTHQP